MRNSRNRGPELPSFRLRLLESTRANHLAPAGELCVFNSHVHVLRDVFSETRAAGILVEKETTGACV